MEEQSNYDEDEDFLEPELPQKRTVPTVFRWENGGKEILLSGSFNDWKTRIPMTLRLVLHKNFQLHLFGLLNIWKGYPVLNGRYCISGNCHQVKNVYTRVKSIKMLLKHLIYLCLFFFAAECSL